jgi:hypothetical protein
MSAEGGGCTENTMQFSHLAFEALLAIIEQGKRNRAVVNTDCSGRKDSAGGCCKHAAQKHKELHIHSDT